MYYHCNADILIIVIFIIREVAENVVFHLLKVIIDLAFELFIAFAGVSFKLLVVLPHAFVDFSRNIYKYSLSSIENICCGVHEVFKTLVFSDSKFSTLGHFMDFLVSVVGNSHSLILGNINLIHGILSDLMHSIKVSGKVF